jgi:predicted DCC family thiol-disulfide oxidoreductase YuxK
VSPPARPLMLYDGECGFCARWIRRWKQTTGDRVEYLAFQDPRVVDLFADMPRDALAEAVHLVETDGGVYRGAEAAFRALANHPEERWLLEWYESSPGFAWLSERGYQVIAENRRFFSILTRIAFGDRIERPAFCQTRRLFLQALALIYFIAFVSLWVQVKGLIGHNGIIPADLSMKGLAQQAEAAKAGWQRYHLVPTLCWLSASDRFLQIQCGAGAALSLMVLIGIAPAPCLFLLWLIYLSLATVGREFLGFQWDNLLLETGFLAIFLAPLQLLPRGRGVAPPSGLVLWLLRWLLFRLMFASGLVKLLSGDPTWRNLTALKYHYETQPLPTWVAWYADQLPVLVQKVSTALMFGIELAVPFLFFAPWRWRRIGCLATISLQILILVTGNYCFFNLLTIALCLLLVDDAALQGLMPTAWRRGAEQSAGGRKWPLQATVPLTCVVLLVSLMQFGGMFRIRIPWPSPVIAVYEWLMPLRIINSYGLFAVMTTLRPEIIIEGSNDQVTWREYKFKYKPGDLRRAPKFVEPHQPRLDWQMWFAALSDYQHDPWIINFCVRLLQGSPEVPGLMAKNPFPYNPPHYIRAVVYEYHFTDFATRRRTGEWWRRERKGNYMPVLSLNKSGAPLNEAPQAE